MATIEVNGRKLAVSHTKKSSTRPQLRATGRISGTPSVGSFDYRVRRLLREHTERDLEDVPDTRGELTTDDVRVIAEAAIEQMAHEHGEPVDVAALTLKRIEIKQVEPVKNAYNVSEPDDESYPSDGTDADKVRWLLENEEHWPADRVVAAVGCSRSLVSELDGE